MELYQEQRPMMYIDVLSAAIEHYGEKNQLVVATEELSELSKELCKAYRQDPPDYSKVNNKKAIVEELSDTIIMLTQIIEIFDINIDDINDEIDFKIKRLLERINNDQEKQKVILSADEFRAKAPLYYSFQRRLINCGRKIKEIEEDMASIHSPFPDRVKIKNKYIAVPKAHGDPHLKEQRRLDLIEKKAQKEAEYKSYADKLDEIDAALRLITTKYDNNQICAKELIERVYIRRNKIEDVANDIGYSKSGLYDFMDQVLKESLDPES